jgi:hypothetical protein
MPRDGAIIFSDLIGKLDVRIVFLKTCIEIAREFQTRCYPSTADLTLTAASAACPFANGSRRS